MFQSTLSVGNGMLCSCPSNSHCKGWQRINHSRFYFNTTSNMFSSKVPEPSAVRATTVPLLDSLISGEDDLPVPAALQLLGHHAFLAGCFGISASPAPKQRQGAGLPRSLGPGDAQGLCGQGKGFCLHSTPHPAGPQTQHGFTAHKLKTQNPGGEPAVTCYSSPLPVP